MREFSQEELDLLKSNGVTPEEADKVLTMFPQSLESALGYLAGLKKGQGQERTEPFTPMDGSST
ncbi:hypothetical protein A2635_01060 [Candidatus Peribacteria bacterium RIFCSPHIGHO2_01_FULL_51_9]|nr:MAG: hypothetical protein A2635_01060 [Candidatus Peribacteria bacterium RIFCSPHIGHO2_01_FULL_51_9]